MGTHNQKKLAELQSLLEPLKLDLVSLGEVDSIVVEETGTTFIENARLKAVEQAKHLGMWTIGEDSGICVPHLDGSPGVYSARYSGPNATDQSNNDKLLAELENAKGEQRAAYYVCTCVVSNPQGEVVLEAEGECWGRIRTKPSGEGGFGYDPLFEVVEYHQTFAELGGRVKSVLSHRAKALAKLTSGLRRLCEEIDAKV